MGALNEVDQWVVSHLQPDLRMAGLEIWWCSTRTVVREFGGTGRSAVYAGNVLLARILNDLARGALWTN